MQNQKGNIGVIASLIVVLIFIGFLVFILINKKDKVDPLEGINQNVTQEQTETTNNPTKNMEKISKNGDVLLMNYTGRLTNGTVFDSNVDPKFQHVEPFRFTLGAGQVIKGWDEGLLGMKVGEKKTLTISPDKGYGDRAVSVIPANSTLIFDVELVGIE
jgi:FKBP-type peptidyl-prolyl cis-trans isomerase